MIKIAVLLTVFNRKEKTINSLNELYNSFKLFNLENKYAIDVYLTDDGCTDGTSAEVQKNFPQVIILKSKGDLFWNRGMINSWKEAAKKKYDFYIWLNDDTYLNKDAFNILFKDYYSVDSKSIISGCTKSKINNATTYGGWLDGKILNPSSIPQSCTHMNGNFVLIPKVVFEVLGTMDPLFRHAGGDTDYSLRGIKNNINTYVTSDYIGFCELHDSLQTCFNPSKSIADRFKHLYTPLGCNPLEYYIFDKRHNGILSACKHFISIHLRVLFPKLWLKNN